jgi:sec-independent protein translocase protein TatB
MLDVAPTELLLVAVVAVIVIGPKDLPRAMRVVGYWVGKMRGVARQFRSGFDDMVREAEFAEMEKKWAEENARIMREFPSADTPPSPALPGPAAALPAPDQPAADQPVPAMDAPPIDAPPIDSGPVMTAEPTLFDDPVPATPAEVTAEPTPPKPKRKRAPKAAS